MLSVRQIDKKPLPGAPFSAKDRFFVDFRVPEDPGGYPNIGRSW